MGEGRWQGWVRFNSLREAVRAARWAAGLETTKNKTGHVRQQLNARPGQSAGHYVGDMPAGICGFFARFGHNCRQGADCPYTHTFFQPDFQFMDVDPERVKTLWARRVGESTPVIVDGECQTVTVVKVDDNEMTVRLGDGKLRTLDMDQLIRDTADHHAPREEK